MKLGTMHRGVAAGSLCAILLFAASSAFGADTLARVKQAGVIKIGYRADARPHSYVDASGRPAGYIVELCREVVSAVRTAIGTPDLKTDFITVTSEDRFTAVGSGTIDLLCEPSSITISRRELVDFSLPTFIDGAGVLHPQGAVIRRFEDFAGKKVGVLSGTTSETVLRDAVRDLALNTQIRPVKDHLEGAALVSRGELDAYFGDRSILSMMLAGRDAPRGLQLGSRYFSYETYGLAMQRGDNAFRLLVDRTLARLYRSGRADELIRTTFRTEPDNVLQALIAINAIPD